MYFLILRIRLYLFIVILAGSVKLMGFDLRDEDDDEDEIDFKDYEESETK